MRRPRVVLFGEASVDGRITVAPGVLLLFGDERWPGTEGQAALERMLQLHHPQAMLEGSGSFLPEGVESEPLPAAPPDARLAEDFVPDDIARRPGFRGWFVVVDGRGRVRWYYTGEPGREAPGSEGWHLLVVTSRAAPLDYLAYLRREHVAYVIAGEEGVDLAAALVKLRGLGVETVLATSPGKLGHALLRAGLVDEIDLDFLPAVIGGAQTPSLFGGPEIGPGERPWPLTLRACEAVPGGRVCLRYDVERPEGAKGA